MLQQLFSPRYSLPPSHPTTKHMETITTTTPADTTWWLFTLPPFLHRRAFPDTFLLLSLLAAWATTVLLAWLLSPGGAAWRDGRGRRGRVPIPGPRGLPVLGSLLALSRGLPHRTLAALARSHSATQLMAFSVGSTPAVVSSNPALAREILSHPSFADRPLKRSARDLMFARAMGFAPAGAHWRLLRRIAGSHLFAPHRVAAREPSRRRECAAMLRSVAREQSSRGRVALRPHLQATALGTIMDSVFGRTYAGAELDELCLLVREGFDLLGAFNWSDHLPWLNFLYSTVSRRCAALVPRVRRFVKRVIDERRSRVPAAADVSAFVDVLLSLEGDEKLQDDDMIAVLWEMIFRGTDTTALLTEWVMAELVLHRDVQTKLRTELFAASEDADLARLPYLQAVIKETLRVHPPGPLLSWARLSSADVQLSNGMVVPAGTTAMVNMWSITHDASVWAEPERFDPGRFEVADVDVRGGDLRLAPFGAGRRVCPGKNLGMAAVGLWVAELVRAFEWGEAEGAEVRLDEVLKLSCEMKSPLVAVAAVL